MTDTPDGLPLPEADLLQEITRIIRQTTKAYGWQHLSAIGTGLRQRFPDFKPADFGCKNLLQFIERYPDQFKVKWSAPARKGASHVWVRLAQEPKHKAGSVVSASAVDPKPEPQLMSHDQFGQLGAWLSGPQGCNLHNDASDPDGMSWTCDGTLRLTRRWLHRHQLDIHLNIARLRQLGAYCDCEVLLNVLRTDSW